MMGIPRRGDKGRSNLGLCDAQKTEKVKAMSKGEVLGIRLDRKHNVLYEGKKLASQAQSAGGKSE